jgi:hypothetical protein
MILYAARHFKTMNKALRPWIAETCTPFLCIVAEKEFVGLA